MRNKLCIALFGALLLSVLVFSSGMALPAYAASSVSATAPQTAVVPASADVHAAVVPQSRRDYLRGWRDGDNAAVHICRDSKHKPGRLRHKRRESDYNAGFVDGFNYALDHERACKHK